MQRILPQNTYRTLLAMGASFPDVHQGAVKKRKWGKDLKAYSLENQFSWRNLKQSIIYVFTWIFSFFH